MTEQTAYAYREWTDAVACSAPYLDAVVLDAIGPFPAGTRILDVGCGNGHFARLLVDRGAEVVGIDLSETGIATSREHVADARFEVLAAGEHLLERLACPPFDVVVSTEVIEHLYSPVSFVRGVASALVPGGRLVLSTPYHGWLKNSLLAVSGRFDDHVNPLFEGGHIKFFSRRTLTQLLGEAGFTDLEFTGAGRVPYLWKSDVVAATRHAA